MSNVNLTSEQIAILTRAMVLEFKEMDLDEEVIASIISSIFERTFQLMFYDLIPTMNVAMSAAGMIEKVNSTWNDTEEQEPSLGTTN